jgi:hypothetical protein
MSMSRFHRWLRRRDRGVRAANATQLHRCGECGGGFVHPVTWTESGPADWWLLLRCGACGAWRDVVASNQLVAEFDRALDDHMDTIRIAADRLERESFRAAADTLGTALRLDLLGADDFR